MFSTSSAIIAFSLIATLNQHDAKFRDFSVTEMSYCVSVGQMAMQMTKFRGLGYNKANVTSLARINIDGDLTLWINPVADLVFSKPRESSEKVIKQAIGYCLDTMRRHYEKSKQRKDYL